MSARPNFFVVGAPRCGTTKLHVDLGKHPQIFMPARKEPHFFCTDVNEAYKAHQRSLGRAPEHLLETEADYLKIFADARDEVRVGESSVYYLYSDAALEGIHAFDPTAKILILIREPVSFLHSLHGRLYSMVDETQPFAKAIALEDERRAGRKVPRTARSPGLLYYSDYARFSERIRAWQERFGEDQVRVVLLDDLRADADGTYRSLLEFLGVEPRPAPTDTPTNANVEARSRTLAYWLRRTWLDGRWRPRIHGRLERWNAREARRRPLDEALRKELAARYREEVSRLSDVLERDLLTLWRYEG